MFVAVVAIVADVVDVIVADVDSVLTTDVVVERAIVPFSQLMLLLSMSVVAAAVIVFYS